MEYKGLMENTTKENNTKENTTKENNTKENITKENRKAIMKKERTAAKEARKEQKRQEKMEFRTAMMLERRQHRKSFIVFSILRVLVIFCMVRQFMVANYEGFALCILTLLLFGLPSYIQTKLRVELPQTLEIIIMMFIFAAEILGEVNNFYTIIPLWDTLLHTLNGFLAAGIGFSLVLILNRNEKIMFSLSPLYLAIVAFCFSMTIGVLWEFFEFTMDMLFGLDMQKDTVVHSISSILLNTTGAQRPVAIRHITDTVVNGESLGIGGYLDIGLIDTMEDLFVNFIGALVFSFLGYFALRGDRKHRDFTNRFMVRPKTPQEDYLHRLQKKDPTLLKEMEGSGTEAEMQVLEAVRKNQLQFTEDKNIMK